MRRQRRGDERCRRERRCEPRKRRARPRIRHFRRQAGDCRAIPCARRSARNRCQVHGQADDDVERRERSECRAPSPPLLQRQGKRPEHRAREPAEERERRDRAPIERPAHDMERRERRVVERERHRGARHQESRDQRGRPLCGGEERQRQRPEAGAAREREPRVTRVDPAPDRRRHRAGEKEPGGIRAEQQHVAHAELRPHRCAEHGDGVEQRSPRDDLGDAEGGDPRAQMGRRLARGLSAHAAASRRAGSHAPRCGRERP